MSSITFATIYKCYGGVSPMQAVNSRMIIIVEQMDNHSQTNKTIS